MKGPQIHPLARAPLPPRSQKPPLDVQPETSDASKCERSASFKRHAEWKILRVGGGGGIDERPTHFRTGGSKPLVLGLRGEERVGKGG